MEYLARQPIFDADRHVRAYELLFRNSEDNHYNADDQDEASKMTLATAMLVGLDLLSEGQKLFLNGTRDLIVGGYVTLFPPATTVVEVLESVEPEEDVIAACRKLKDGGFQIALDDFVDRPDYAPLVELADIIKVDFRKTPLSDRTSVMKRYGGNGRQMLAEKVETEEEFECAKKSGFSLFQGYFFCKPKVVSAANSQSLNPQHVRLLRLLGDAAINFKKVEELIKSDPALCYRLLRYLNSAAFGFKHEIRSIRQALVMLGETDLRKWLLVVSTVLSGNASKREVIINALVRARFIELVGSSASQPESLLFMLGLLSLMDAILDLPASTIAEQLAISEEVRSALLGKPGESRKYLDLVVAYETGNWRACDGLSVDCRVAAGSLGNKYLEAVRWTKALVSD